MHDAPPESSRPSEPPQPIEFTRGFVAFLGAMVLPAILALGIFLGAWAVSDEVYAAEAASAEGGAADAGVAGWKQSLVGVCPIH